MSQPAKVIEAVAALLIVTLLAGCTGGPEVEQGDFVKVAWSGRIESNGTVFDTSDPKLRDQHPGKNITLRDASAEWVYLGSKPIPEERIPSEVPSAGIATKTEGFRNALVDKRKGETYNGIRVFADDAFGKVDPEKVETVPRIRTLNRSINLTVRYLVGESNFSDETRAGDTIWLNHSEHHFKVDGEIQAFNDTTNNVSLYLLPSEGQTVSLQHWNGTIVEVGNSTFDLRQDPVEGRTYGEFWIREVTPTTFVKDRNHIAAGETVIYDVQIRDILEPETNAGGAESGGEAPEPQSPETHQYLNIVASFENDLDTRVWISTDVRYGLEEGKSCWNPAPDTGGFPGSGEFSVGPQSSRIESCTMYYPDNDQYESSVGWYDCRPDNQCPREAVANDKVSTGGSNSMRMDVEVRTDGSIEMSWSRT